MHLHRVKVWSRRLGQVITSITAKALQLQPHAPLLAPLLYASITSSWCFLSLWDSPYQTFFRQKNKKTTDPFITHYSNFLLLPMAVCHIHPLAKLRSLSSSPPNSQWRPTVQWQQWQSVRQPYINIQTASGPEGELHSKSVRFSRHIQKDLHIPTSGWHTRSCGVSLHGYFPLLV